MSIKYDHTSDQAVMKLAMAQALASRGMNHPSGVLQVGDRVIGYGVQQNKYGVGSLDTKYRNIDQLPPAAQEVMRKQQQEAVARLSTAEPEKIEKGIRQCARCFAEDASLTDKAKDTFRQMHTQADGTQIMTYLCARHAPKVEQKPMWDAGKPKERTLSKAFRGAMAILKSVEDDIAAHTANGVTNAKIHYTAKGSGEEAVHHMQLGVDLKSIYERDADKLRQLIPHLSGVHHDAATEMLESRRKSIDEGIGNNPAYTNKDTYESIAPGVKRHKESGHIHVHGITMGKDVIKPGVYKQVKSSDKTIAKRQIEKELEGSKYRQFTIKNVHGMSLDGSTINIKGE